MINLQIFNVGSNEQNYRIQAVGKIIKQLVPSAELIFQGLDTDRRDYRVSFDKIQNTLNFMPKWTVEKGVMQVIHALQTDVHVDYRAAEYSNVKLLKRHCLERLPYHYGRWAQGMIDRSTALGKSAPVAA